MSASVTRCHLLPNYVRMSYTVALLCLFLVAVLYLYICLNDAKLMHCPTRVSARDALEAAAAWEKTATVDPKMFLPPKTGRRYIVVGGAGFLGGWIVRHLLERGEHPKQIRVLDVRAPTRPDLITGLAKHVDFHLGDISDRAQVQAAFSAPWPSPPADTSREGSSPASAQEITVFHTAANIRFYERDPRLLHLSDKVNVEGTRNVLDAARAAGRRPRLSVQTFDDDAHLPRRHEEMFSNYAASKLKAERLVNPSWIHDILQNFIYVENASLAHFCYEQRLIEKAQGSRNPDVGGRAFSIVDAGPPVTYGDVYTVLTTLTDGRTVFPRLSATAMLMLSHILEGLHLISSFATLSSNPFLRRLGQLVPAPTGDLINLQPSLFSLTMVHLIWDDSHARSGPEIGGLGYKPRWTTLSALCKLVEEHKKADGQFEARSMGGGVSFGFWMDPTPRGGMRKVIKDLATDATLGDE
ncbi:hypothetical protein BC826DRAFT_1017565 [Russula brevipes]|nr:hypothetical protein BC826DRAFT_1017565 [Russula brevipes]